MLHASGGIPDWSGSNVRYGGISAGELVGLRAALDEKATADRRHELGARWQQLLGEIRRRPGFERFLLAPGIDQLRARVRGPVATINVSRHRCDALVLDSDGVHLIELSRLTEDELTDRAEAFADALPIAENNALGYLDRMTAQDTVRTTLEWLWDTVTGPVLDALGYTARPAGPAPWPRLWWSPTGLLNFLPLHAAGHHHDGPTVLERVVSSTSTVHALSRTAASAPSEQPGGLLVVGMRDTPGHRSLPAALSEATSLVTDGDPRPLLDEHATRRNVLAALPNCDWAHFACHAHSDPAYPSGSHLVLHDQPLTVTDIGRLRVPHAQLAYLSACSTARGSTQLAGEAIHLGSAFQIAGFHHTVATLWPVADTVASGVAQDFYRRLDPHRPAAQGSVALALNEAVRAAREADPALPTAGPPTPTPARSGQPRVRC